MDASPAKAAGVAPPPTSIWSRARLWTCNTFIVAVILVIVIDVFPFFPENLRLGIDPIMDKAGLWQGAWGMFAPGADTVNTRYSAEIEYDDGTLAHWSSPEWRRLSYFSRFTISRYLEYLDNEETAASVTVEDYIDNPSGIQLKQAMADFIVRTHPGPHPDCPVKRVVIYKELATIPAASDGPWTTWAELAPFGEPDVLFQK